MVLKKIFDVNYRPNDEVMEVTIRPPANPDDLNELTVYIDSVIGTGVNAQAEGAIRKLNGYGKKKGTADPTHVRLRIYNPSIQDGDIILANIHPGFEPQMRHVYQRLKGIADRNQFGSD